MKATKQLLIVIGLMTVLTIFAQDTYITSEVQMYSTSAMIGSGSSLPQAAVTGTHTTYDESDNSAFSGPKRIIADDDEEDKENDGWKEPGIPLGDIPWVMVALLAIGYAIYLSRKTGLPTPDSRK